MLPPPSQLDIEYFLLTLAKQIGNRVPYGE